MHSPHPYNGLPGVHLSTVQSGWVRFEKCIGALMGSAQVRSTESIGALRQVHRCTFQSALEGNRALFMPHIPLIPVPDCGHIRPPAAFPEKSTTYCVFPIINSRKIWYITAIPTTRCCDGPQADNGRCEKWKQRKIRMNTNSREQHSFATGATAERALKTCSGRARKTYENALGRCLMPE